MSMTSRARFLAPYPQFAVYRKGRWAYPKKERILDPDYLVVDLNLRPAPRTIDARAMFKTRVDWDAAVEKALYQLKKMFLRCGFACVRADVEGICDDGTMACVLVLYRPLAEPLKRIAKLLREWHIKEAGVLGCGHLVLNTMDKSNKRQVVMLAEDFYVTPSKKEGTIPGTVPLCEWEAFAAKLTTSR